MDIEEKIWRTQVDATTGASQTFDNSTMKVHRHIEGKKTAYDVLLALAARDSLDTYLDKVSKKKQKGMSD